MTAQMPDRLVHRGRVRALYATPLYGYLRRLPKSIRPDFVWTTTANWRGYVATWEIIGSQLFLINIEGYIRKEDGSQDDASLARCFPWRRHPIHATWVSGSLRCPEGRRRFYVHHGFSSHYERDRVFHVKKGRIEAEWLIHNPPEPLQYRIEPDGSRLFFEDRDGPSPDPFPAGSEVEPWRLWGRPDWGVDDWNIDDLFD
jgi:hypothetical protein